MQRKDLVIVLALSSVICGPIHLFNASCGSKKHQNRFNQKVYLGKNLVVAIVYFWHGHTSLKIERNFFKKTIFTTT